ncbi:replication initiator protein A [Planococcus sp. S3-L1]|uniref:replication initiator protein A n=1 Tax=Planococcus sp. S3-L1 TaxID=3046200 RepID=UPI0024B8DE38|nr:replication initiator protein A [Planococcus sp. S3-L1]MDJ0332999.1 replication initiator protein A [Planococcus sp. S3-L1]
MNGKYNIREEAAQRFYRLPKVFFTNERYKKISNDAKIAFAILQDRLDLSIKNEWFDDEGNIYFLYGNQQLAEILNCSKPTVIKIKKELHQVVLLEEKRMGLSQSNRLYLLKPVAEVSDVKPIDQSTNEPGSLGGQQKLKSFTSRNQTSLLQEVKIFNTNDTDLNNTDLSKTEIKIHQLKEKTTLPESIVQVLIKHQQRLMDDHIEVEEIANHYFAHQEVLTVHQYADALQYSLERTPGRIKSITARLTKAVEDKKKWLGIQTQPPQQPIRTEKVPEWLNQSKVQQTASNTLSPEEIATEKERVLSKLAKRKSK